MNGDNMMIFAGSGSRKLTRAICTWLGVPMGNGEAIQFSEGNTFVRILENVRGRDVFIVQSTVFPANDNLVELLFWIDAFKRASAESVTAVIPYFSYGKGDKKDEPRVSIRARVVADAIEAAGVDRVVTMDLHAPQIQGFFRVPVDNLYALPALCDRVEKLGLDNLVVVSPDSGFVKQARKYARHLGVSLTIADKERTAHDETAAVMAVIGDVRDKTALIVDDFTISGGTLTAVAEQLIKHGARGVYAMVAHGVLGAGSIERIHESPITKLLITDSIENQPVTFSDKIETVSVAPLFGDAMKRIYNRESVSEMFG
ncbi:MAG: ribose-phosphate pyrophosphokinase [candidate division Zixibacteria bacterium]|nr:ribose-phosphate pyrophosphokinase [candidate division Zixibacteria bacterium]MDH4035246.1 ribose-phosphate pyrophosphokinase [candidate division Zixibacteria bacterium]